MKFTKEKFLKKLTETYIKLYEQPTGDEFVDFSDEDEYTDEDDDEGEQGDENDPNYIRVSKKDKNVKQRGLYKKDTKQFGTMVRREDDPETWVQAYFPLSCPGYTERNAFKEKYADEINDLKTFFKSKGVTVVIVENDTCPDFKKNRRPWENFKLKRLIRKNIIIRDYETGDIIPNELFASWVKQHPRGVHAILLFLDGQLIKTFPFDNSTQTKTFEVQENKSIQYIQYLLNDGIIDSPDRIRTEVSMNRNPIQRKIKNKIYPILREEFSDKTEKGKEFLKILNQRSIPGLIIDNPKFEDRYQPTWTNNKIKYRIVSFNIYDSSDAFLQAVFNRSLGDESPELNTTNTAIHVRGIYAKEKPRRETRPTDADYIGKSSEIEPNYERIGNYNVMVKDLYDDNDIMLKTELFIVGELIGNTYVWTVNMTNSFGRKKPEEFSVKTLNPLKLSEDSFLNDGSTIAVSESVQLNNNDFSEKYTIASNNNILMGLRMAIEKFKTEVENIDPLTLLDTAAYDRSDIQRVDESILNLVKQSIREIYLRR